MEEIVRAKNYWQKRIYWLKKLLLNNQDIVGRVSALKEKNQILADNHGRDFKTHGK